MQTRMLISDSENNRGSGGIRDARRRAGLSQEQLARIAGCSTASVRLFESGYAPKHSDVLGRILGALTNGSTLLATRRRDAGLTQHQLALHSGVDEATVTRLEAGERCPDRTTAERIAATLQTSVDLIFPDRGRSR